MVWYLLQLLGVSILNCLSKITTIYFPGLNCMQLNSCISCRYKRRYAIKCTYLFIDIDAGTMGVLYYDASLDLYYKAVVISPVPYLSEKVRNQSDNLVITGKETGGGTLAGILKERALRMEKEALTLESLAIAMAVKNSNGSVIVQVERVAEQGTLNARQVKIPGILVDCVVVARPENHWQTFAEIYNPAFSSEIKVPVKSIESMPWTPEKSSPGVPLLS
jgi:hypothetical protein